MIELHAIFHGYVQGVGFRWTVSRLAEKLGLNGSVHNLDDGTVEVYIQGEKQILEDFLTAIESYPGAARIESVSIHYQNMCSLASEFRII